MENDLPKIFFPEFSTSNEGMHGWWHISCSYSASEKRVQGTLCSRNSVQVHKEKPYPENGLVYPSDGSMFGNFGHSLS